MSPRTVSLYEWERKEPTPDSPLAGVFLDEEPTVQRLARELSRSGILEIAEMRRGIALRAMSYVGRIQLGGLQITIRPKLRGMPLLQLLRYAYGLRNLKLFSPSEMDAEPEAFQEIFVRQLAEEAAELVARGLARRYVQQSQPLSSPRGRIDVGKIARAGGMVGAALPFVHHPRLEDHLLNQTLLSGLRLGESLTRDLSLKVVLRRLSSRLKESVTSIRLDREVFQRLRQKSDRLVAAYQPALALIELLFSSQGLSLGEDEERVRVPGFLFDMNRFFQRLLARFLRENLSGYEVREEHSLSGMMAYRTGHNPQRRRAPVLRPDFVVLQGGKNVALLDAKYRDLWETSLPREMLYQLSLYALSQEANGSAVILYPTLSLEARPQIVELRGPLRNEPRAQVILRPVDLGQLAKLVSSDDGLAPKRQREDFALRLILGRELELDVTL